MSLLVWRLEPRDGYLLQTKFAADNVKSFRDLHAVDTAEAEHQTGDFHRPCRIPGKTLNGNAPRRKSETKLRLVHLLIQPPADVKTGVGSHRIHETSGGGAPEERGQERVPALVDATCLAQMPIQRSIGDVGPQCFLFDVGR